jgi:hypothetical protein
MVELLLEASAAGGAEEKQDKREGYAGPSVHRSEKSKRSAVPKIRQPVSPLIETAPKTAISSGYRSLQPVSAMDTSITAVLSSGLRTLPASGAERNLRLQRLIDLYAAAEAATALAGAAARARDARDPLADILSAAQALWTEVGVPHVAPESEQARAEARGRLTRAMVGAGFEAVVSYWVRDLRGIANREPATGACIVATALQLWTWTLSHVLREFDVVERDVALAELSEALCQLIAARAHVVSVSDAAKDAFFVNLCHVQAAEAAGEVGTLCAELVFGHRTHPSWEACDSCYRGQDLDELEGLVPGIASTARAYSDVIESNGSHPVKAGPCATLNGVAAFARLRTKLDGCLTGARLAKRHAADALPRHI